MLIRFGAAALIVLTSAVAQAAARYQDPLDVAAMRSGIAARSPLLGIARAGDRLVAVGLRGHILFSNDQGKAWTQAQVPVSSDLTAVWFSTPQQGWAVGHDGVVLRSQDGGLTWTKQLDGRAAAALMASTYEQRAAAGDAAAAAALDEARRLVEDGPDKPFLDVWFEDERTGFVVGAFNLILKTTDAGKTWEPWLDRIENPKGLHLYSVRGAGGDVFIVGEQGLVLRLDRDAQRFVALESPYRGSFFGVLAKPGRVLAFGLRGNVFGSDDRGQTWRKVETKLDTGLTAGAVLPDGKIALVSQGGQLLVSADDGRSFTSAKVPRPMPLAGIGLAGDGEVVLAGYLGVQVAPLQ